MDSEKKKFVDTFIWESEPKLCINHWKVLYKLCVFYVDRNSKMTTTAGHSFYIGPIGFFYYQVNDTHLKELSTCNRYTFCTCIRTKLLLLTNVLSFQVFLIYKLIVIYNRRNYDNFTYRDTSFYRISWRFHSFWKNKCNF
jgi:hypothetical protein